MIHVVMAEIHASVLFSRAVTRLSGRLMKLARPVPGPATRNTNSPHTFALHELLAPSWRGSRCFGRGHLNAPVRGSPMLIEAGFDIAFECPA